MTIKYTISPSAMAFDWVLKIWESQSDGPGAEVHTRNIPQPHNTPYVFMQSGFDRVPHRIRLYAVPSNNLLHDYEEEPTEDGIELFDPIRFTIGDGGANTPAAGTNTYTNPLLVGLADNKYEVHRNNYGILFPGKHYTTDPATGSWALIPPDQFNGGDDLPGEEFVIKRATRVITTVVNDSVVAKWFGGFVDVAANTAYLNEHLRKLIRFTGTASYTFGAMDAVPIGYAFCFQNFGNNTIGHINFLNGGLKFGIGFINGIDLPNFCEAAFVWDGTFWNVIYLTSSTFINNPNAVAGQVLGLGSTLLGNVGSDAFAHTITHNLAIAGDYQVQMSVRGTAATQAADVAVNVVWYHHADKPNKFVVVTDELVGGSLVNNITIEWIIFKK